MPRVYTIVKGFKIGRAVTDIILTNAMQNAEKNLLQVAEWYKQEVASFKHVYYSYPNVEAALRPILLQAQPRVSVGRFGSTLTIDIQIFDDEPGGYLDKNTSIAYVHGYRKKNLDSQWQHLGWWRFFEEGAPNQRNFGSATHGFIPTGSKFGGGFMISLQEADTKKIKIRPHPGVYKVGFFEKTWIDMKEEYLGRITNAVVSSVG